MGHPFLHIQCIIPIYYYFNQKLKQNSTFNAVEFHINKKNSGILNCMIK